MTQDERAMTTERRLWWAANFFIWSAVIVLVLEVFFILDRSSRGYVPKLSLLDATAMFIIALINGLVLRRYKSPIAAAFFVLFGLTGFGLGMFKLLRIDIVYLAASWIVFFGVYLAIAAWTLVAALRLRGGWGWSHSVLLTRNRFRELLERPDKLETENRALRYYLQIAKAVSQLPLDDPTSRQEVYDRARTVLAEYSANTELERERRALEEAIRSFERDRTGKRLRPPTALISFFSSAFG
jgi:hypothetical protein